MRGVAVFLFRDGLKERFSALILFDKHLITKQKSRFSRLFCFVLNNFRAVVSHNPPK